MGARDASAQAPAKAAPLPGTRSTVPGASTMDKPTPLRRDATSYNNFYEFGTDKADPGATRAHAEDAAVDAWRSRAR